MISVKAKGIFIYIWAIIGKHSNKMTMEMRGKIQTVCTAVRREHMPMIDDTTEESVHWTLHHVMSFM